VAIVHAATKTMVVVAPGRRRSAKPDSTSARDATHTTATAASPYTSRSASVATMAAARTLPVGLLRRTRPHTANARVVIHTISGSICSIA
jgi:hypothetical protein